MIENNTTLVDAIHTQSLSMCQETIVANNRQAAPYGSLANINLRIEFTLVKPEVKITSVVINRHLLIIF